MPSPRLRRTKTRGAKTSSCKTEFLNAARRAAMSCTVLAALTGTAAAQSVPNTITINGYTVIGNHILTELEVDTAVYPFLGPNQTVQSVDKARAALQKVYADKGYQTVAVNIPVQHVQGGVVILQVVEEPVGRLHINGSRYFSLDKIKSQAPSLKPGTVPNFNDIKHDIFALNTWPDRQVTPTLQPGARPETVDVDLNVQDSLPLHGTLSLDNTYSANTTPLRIDGSLWYDNLWQRGDTLQASFEVAPQHPNDDLIFSGGYTARIPNIDWLTLALNVLVSNSKVAPTSSGSFSVVGRGQSVGLSAQATLPGGSGFSDTLTSGIAYKNFAQITAIGAATGSTPDAYYPINATYSAAWQGDHSSTQLDIGPTFNIRGFGSSLATFDNKRYDAQGDFIYLRGDLSRQQDLPAKFQLAVSTQGQISNEPLVSSEEFAIGGVGTVRGYLQAEVQADDGIVGSVELRTPSLAEYLGPKVSDWRVFIFGDGAQAKILDPLPQQQASFSLASLGAGTTIQLIDHLNGDVDVAIPLITSTYTNAYHPRVEFKVWMQY